MADEIQEWAKQRACDLANAERDEPGYWKVSDLPYETMLRAFARYIQPHEEAPVDPCVIEGRKLVVETQHDWPDSPWHLTEAAETLAGNRDHALHVMAAIEGVRRGLELASQQGDG